MKNMIGFKIGSRRGALLGVVMACAGVLGCNSLTAGETASSGKSVIEPAQDETYNNWLTLGLGGLITHGDAAQFNQEHRVSGDIFGGIDDMHLEKTVGKVQITLDAHAMFDNNDYKVKLEISKADLGYIRAGYTQFRTWYDGGGGYFPLNDSFNGTFPPAASSNEQSVDRGDAWIELGLRMPDLPEITVRYDHTFRNGNKDSTEWGPTTQTGIPGNNGRRYLTPTWLGINEQSDIFTLDIKKTFFGNTDIAIGMRYEHINNKDSEYIQNYPGNSTAAASNPNRYVTQNNDFQSDLFSGHFTSETRFNDKIWFTMGYCYTSMGSDLGGNRINGLTYGSPFVLNQGANIIAGSFYLNESGGSTMTQNLVNLNVMWRPIESLTITPSLRIEQNNTVSDSFFNITGTWTNPAILGVNPTPSHLMSNDDYVTVSGALDLRYTGFENWVLYATGNWEDEQENRSDRSVGSSFLSTGLSGTGVAAATTPLNLNVDATYLRQKYAVGANWYPLMNLNFSLQYYYKVEQNNNTFFGDDGGSIGNQRLLSQDFNTNDVNVRMTWHPLSNLVLITRYDLQYSTITDQWKSPTVVFPWGQSAEMMNQVFSEGATWSPLSWLYLQGNFSYVLNSTHTPASTLVPAVVDFQNDYWTVSAALGIALDDKTKLEADYTYYRANDYVNNATSLAGAASGGIPFGAGSTEHTVTAGITRQLTKNVCVSLKYSYYRYTDQLSGGFDNYDAHVVYSTIQYRF